MVLIGIISFGVLALVSSFSANNFNFGASLIYINKIVINVINVHLFP